MKRILLAAAALFVGSAMAEGMGRDFLVRIAPNVQKSTITTLQSRLPAGTKVQDLGINGWTHVTMPATADANFTTRMILNMPGVTKIEKNMKLGLLENFKVRDARIRKEIIRRQKAGILGGFGETPAADNPEIPAATNPGTGQDPLFNKQWGMNQLGVQSAWATTKGRPEIVVGVIDTGVDYTHEDLVDNMWRNTKEIPNNNVDDDGNGYIDDIVGWDFAAKDNKPYDLTASMFEMLMGGGNPGHGTHCAGNVAARGMNGKGISGVAPNVRIMALRFISEKGQGTTADAIAAIKYGVDNGAQILSNSWGSTGDDGGAESQALQDAIRYSEAKNVLFVAAAGNGDEQGKGYDNDSHAKPAFPATYPFESIVSVAAIDVNGALGTFSNWGARSVDIGAPGVNVFSTVTSSDKYSDTVIDIPGLITAHWDGTSMATPHVAGAAALYLSANPGASFQKVKNALLMSVKKTPTMQGKSVSGGQLDVTSLMNY